MCKRKSPAARRRERSSPNKASLGDDVVASAARREIPVRKVHLFLATRKHTNKQISNRYTERLAILIAFVRDEIMVFLFREFRIFSLSY